MGQIDPFVEDQRRFHAAIGEKNAAAALRQVVFDILSLQYLRDRQTALSDRSRDGALLVWRNWCRIVSRLPRRLVVRLNVGL